MKTFVLPGHSSGNIEWLDTIEKALPQLDLTLIKWPHWASKNDADFNPEQEAAKLADIIGQDEINMIAKSIGSFVTMLLLNEHGIKINKMILCGLPIKGFKEGDGDQYVAALTKFDITNLLWIQNSEDPWASFNQAEEFLHAINPEIKIIEKEASNHSYPYTEEFNSFLS